MTPLRSWQSLRTRLLLTMISLALVGALLGIWLEQRADMTVVKQLTQEKSALVASLVHNASDVSEGILTQDFRELVAKHQLTRLLVIRQGRAVQSSDAALQGMSVDALAAKVWLPDPANWHKHRAVYGASQAFFVYPQDNGKVSLMMWFDTLPSNALQLQNRLRLLVFAFVLCLLGCSVFYWLYRRMMMKPLDDILDVLQRRIGGERTLRVPAMTTYELGQLGRLLNQTMDSEDAALNALNESHQQTLEQQSRFVRIFKSLPDLVTISHFDDGRIVDVNENWVKTIGWQKEEAVGKTASELGLWLMFKDREVLLSKMQNNLFHCERVHFQTRWGERIDAEASGCLFEEQGQAFLLMSFRDISDRLRREHDLHLLAQVVEVSLDGVMITDAQQSILAVNSAFCAITGFSADDVVGKTPRVLSSGYQDKTFYQTMWKQLYDIGCWQGEIWNKRKSGEIYPQWLNIRSVKDNVGQVLHYVAVFSDITDRKAAEARIAFLAYHDPLTGLPNRTRLVERCDEAIVAAARRQQQLAMIYLDLDRFKSINDSLGHDVGDALLKEVVKRLHPLCGDDDVLSRQGGDEFLLLLPNVADRRQVETLVHSILAVMSEPFVVKGHRLWISTSIGVSFYPADGDSTDQLLRRADTALYHAKDSGRASCSYFSQHMDKNLAERLRIESALKDAIGSTQLQLYYQPQIEIDTGRLVGAEALLRWESPDLGAVSPGRFIPLAEETGLIIPLGAWALTEACRELAIWRELGFDGLMAVNISVKQILRADFFTLLESALAESNIPPNSLELELTESLMMDNVEATLEVVQKLKSLDVRLSIDDFGTGYSSLSYLKRFAVDCLKIDQSFIRGLGNDNQQARSLISAIVNMAHNLELQVVAEGVETAEQLAILEAEKVDIAQGYYLGKPQPAEQFRALLQRHSKGRWANL
ncbi:EAL domain-containing protein [Gallaecimonas mangrovi]|uniref:EAL domain-containing protein n=1 Tax=Gallaecimonas mangrovi TaxID=2291597 RepID=UPI000E20B22D|nr:EAL domain-containing protein [Gallaecimonas mangrovi]